MQRYDLTQPAGIPAQSQQLSRALKGLETSVLKAKKAVKKLAAGRVVRKEP